MRWWLDDTKRVAVGEVSFDMEIKGNRNGQSVESLINADSRHQVE